MTTIDNVDMLGSAGSNFTIISSLLTDSGVVAWMLV